MLQGLAVAAAVTAQTALATNDSIAVFLAERL